MKLSLFLSLAILLIPQALPELPWLLLERQAKVPPALPSQIQKKIAKNKPVPAQEGSGSFAHREIEQQLISSRSSLAHCISKDVAFSVPEGRLKLQIRWGGEGALQDLNLSPSPNPEAVACIKEKVASWALPPHPRLQPISFHALLTL